VSALRRLALAFLFAAAVAAILGVMYLLIIAAAVIAGALHLAL
jgi:hypothetical protein